ncbi:MAG: universal stress protein [Halobacteriota archaeon]
MTILAAIGEEADSESVVSAASELATAYGDELVALHVVPQEDFQTHKKAIEEMPDFGDFSVTQEQESAARYAERIVTRALGEFNDDVVEPRGRVGNPADEILAEVRSLDPRYLVIGGRRRSPVGKALFGSTTQRLLLNADCPVVTTMVD